MMIRGKQGSTLTNWVFVILIISLFLVILQGQVLTPMNEMYGNNLTVGGLSDTGSSTITDISAVASSSHDDITNAEISTLSDGVTIVEVGAIAKRTFTTIWDFASGEFLSVLFSQMDLPTEVATVITIMIWLSLIFIIVRIFTRGVSP